MGTIKLSPLDFPPYISFPLPKALSFGGAKLFHTNNKGEGFSPLSSCSRLHLQALDLCYMTSCSLMCSTLLDSVISLRQ